MFTQKMRMLTGILSMTVCLSMFGCGQETEVLYEPDASTAETTVSTAPVTEETIPAETEPSSYLRQQLEEIFGDAQYGFGRDRISQANMIGFTELSAESDTPAEINDEALPVEDGTLQMELNLLLYTKDGAEYDLSTAFVLCWNGAICDFSLDGKQSTDGVLYMDMQQNRECVVPFTAENLPVCEGENTFYFCAVPYCPETGRYWGTMLYFGYYDAEEAREGQAPIPLAPETELDPACIISVKDMDEAMTDLNIAPDSRISILLDDCYKVHANPTFYLNVANYRNSDGPSNRHGFAMLFVDGRLQPIWNDARFAAVSAAETEYTRRYAVKTDFSAGEHRNVCLVYAELQDDKDFSSCYAFSQVCYCDMAE